FGQNDGHGCVFRCLVTLISLIVIIILFFFTSPAPTGIYTLSLHDALPILEAKHWGLRKSRNATSLNSRFKSLDTLKVKIISVTFRRVIRTNHKKASKIWRHENIQLGGCQS